MTTLPVPSAGSPAWRDIYPAPPDLRLESGPWCPIDDAVLVVERRGWVCRTCRAWWPRKGSHGVWLTDTQALRCAVAEVVDLGVRLGPAAARWRRFDQSVAVTILAGIVLGLGAAAGRAYTDEVPNPLLWAAALLLVGLLQTGAGLVLAWRWWTGRGWHGAGKQVPCGRR